jgi:hypothetical protein
VQLNNLTIVNGSFTIHGSLGMGSGDADHFNSTVAHMLIYNGTFRASGLHGPGIGSGSAAFADGSSTVRNLTILNGRFECRGESAGIGSGIAQVGVSVVTHLTINDGYFDVRGTQGFGVGSGLAIEGDSQVYRLRMRNGTYKMRGTRGIGIERPRFADQPQINIEYGSLHIDCDLESASDERPCFEADSIIIRNTSITAVSSGPLFQSAEFAGASKLFVTYTRDSHDEGLLLPAIHFGHVEPLTNRHSLNCSVTIGNDTFPFVPTNCPGFLRTVPGPGNYEVTFKVVDGQIDGSFRFGLNGSDKIFKVGNGEAFFPTVYMSPAIVRTRSYSPTATASITKSPTPEAAILSGDLSQGATIGISIGTGAFIFAILGVVILSKCRNRCELSGEQNPNVVPVGMLISSDALPYIDE